MSIIRGFLGINLFLGKILYTRLSYGARYFMS
jgi:hypothetical protein